MCIRKLSRAILFATTFGLAACSAYLLPFMSVTKHIAKNGPLLVLPRTICELGKISNQQQIRVPFQVSNLGTLRLVINANDDCHRCGDSVRESIVVLPGNSVELVVTLDPRITAGTIEKISEFTTSDPASPRFNLTVRATVEADAPLVSNPTKATSDFIVAWP